MRILHEKYIFAKKEMNISPVKMLIVYKGKYVRKAMNHKFQSWKCIYLSVDENKCLKLHKFYR